MTDKSTVQKSISEQIFDELFAIIQQHPEFDSETIVKLKQLAKNGELKKAPKVTKSIQVTPEMLP